MNFAQLINPEWVRDGMPERVQTLRQVTEQAPQLTVTVHRVLDHLAHDTDAQRVRRTGVARRVMAILMAAKQPLRAAQISLLDAKLGPAAVYSSLLTLRAGGFVNRLGDERPYAYRITPDGRARVARGADG